MKKKFSKILGVGLTLALLTSLLLVAAPVSALTQPEVTLSDDAISRTADYTIEVTIDEDLDETTDDIIIEFDAGIDITDIDDVTVEASAGFGTDAGGPTNAASSTDGQVLTITIPNINAQDMIGRIARVTVVVEGIVNPDEAGDYFLDVSTTEEAAVQSGVITIELPEIVDVPGTVRWYKDGTPMGIDSGTTPISAAIRDAGEGFTIEIEPGTYTENPNTTDAMVTFVATGTAAETIIVGDWTIDEDDTTIDGLTIDGDITVTADDFILENSVIDDGGTLDLTDDGTDATVTDTTFNVEDNAGIVVDEDGAIITGLTFNVEEDGIGVSVRRGVIDTAVEDSTFTGSSGVGIKAAGDITIEGNTFDGLATALDINDGTVTIKFNSILNSEDYGLDTAVDVDATFNWWGTTVAADIGDMITGAGTASYEPFLTDTADVVFSASDVATNATSLDAKDTVGVYVVNTTDTADVIMVAKYTANPQQAIDDAEAFFDVYVVGPASADAVSLRFYVGAVNSSLHIWSADTDQWVDLTEDEDVSFYSVYGGYLFITVDADVLDRTPFAVITPLAVTPPLDLPGIVMPKVGAVDVSPLTPTFDWAAVTGADGYYFELADNPLFVLPLVSVTGDLGRLIETAYTYVGELDYSNAYHWRVKAVSGTIDVGDLAESAWSENVFITMDEPVEPPPPIVIEDVPPPEITIEQPDIIIQPPDVEVIVPLPAETPITPAWIYVIIGIGAVLVIALIVLTVRTRRVT